MENKNTIAISRKGLENLIQCTFFFGKNISLQKRQEYLREMSAQDLDIVQDMMAIAIEFYMRLEQGEDPHTAFQREFSKAVQKFGKDKTSKMLSVYNEHHQTINNTLTSLKSLINRDLQTKTQLKSMVSKNILNICKIVCSEEENFHKKIELLDTLSNLCSHLEIDENVTKETILRLEQYLEQLSKQGYVSYLEQIKLPILAAIISMNRFNLANSSLILKRVQRLLENSDEMKVFIEKIGENPF